MLTKPDPTAVLARMRSAGHTVFESDSVDFNLNLIGIRSRNPQFDRFNDVLYAMWKFQGVWSTYMWPITTLPGKYFMVDRLLNREGCAILAPGQYRGAYAIGKHRGKYDALCQRKGAVTVFRDGDRDEEFDLLPSKKRNGWYGINIHRCGAGGKVPKVGRNSAGCQVFQNSDHFDHFMRLLYKSRDLWGNTFTYTLLQA